MARVRPMAGRSTLGRGPRDPAMSRIGSDRRRWTAESHDDHVDAGVQSFDVLGIRRHDPVAARSSSEYHRRVDDIGGVRSAAAASGVVIRTGICYA